MAEKQFPPNYEEAAQSSSGPSRVTVADPKKSSIRYLYYQIFEDGMVGKTKNNIPELDEPSIGRIRARDIAPPRTVGIIKRAIAKAEDIPLSRISGLFLLAGASGEAASDSMRLDILDERGRGPGGSAEVPIAIVIGQEEETFASAVMSQSEPGKVVSDARPTGWKLAKTTRNGTGIHLCLAMKPRGGLRWMDGTLDDGKLLWVNPAGFVTLSDWSGSYPMYPVILQETRLYGFMPVNSIDFISEPQPSGKGKLHSSFIGMFKGSSSSS